MFVAFSKYLRSKYLFLMYLLSKLLVYKSHIEMPLNSPSSGLRFIGRLVHMKYTQMIVLVEGGRRLK